MKIRFIRKRGNISDVFDITFAASVILQREHEMFAFNDGVDKRAVGAFDIILKLE
jgi:hypothetical protein